jgi:hypothetical protein
LAGNDRNQLLAADQLLEFSFILNARQLQAINFLVLSQQRIVGRTEYRIPKHTAKTGPTFAGAMHMLAGRDLMQPKSLSTHDYGQNYQQKSSLGFKLHEVCLKS